MKRKGLVKPRGAQDFLYSGVRFGLVLLIWGAGCRCLVKGDPNLSK